MADMNEDGELEVPLPWVVLDIDEDSEETFVQARLHIEGEPFVTFDDVDSSRVNENTFLYKKLFRFHEVQLVRDYDTYWTFHAASICLAHYSEHTPEQSVRTLGLQGGELTGDQFEILSNALTLSMVRTLCFRDVNIRQSCFAPLTRMLSSTACRLEVLDINSSSQFPNGFIEALAQGLRSPTCKLQQLEIDFAQMVGTDLRLLGDVVRNQPNLHNIRFENNTLRPTGYDVGDMAYFMDAFQAPTSKVTTLRMIGTELLCHDDVFPIFARVISSVTCPLKFVTLADMDLKDEQGVELANAIKSGSNITNLLLDENHCLGVHTAHAFAEAILSPVCNLQKLGIGNSPLSEAGCRVLAKALSSRMCRLYNFMLDISCLISETDISSWRNEEDYDNYMKALVSEESTQRFAEIFHNALKSKDCTLGELELYTYEIDDEGTHDEKILGVCTCLTNACLKRRQKLHAMMLFRVVPKLASWVKRAVERVMNPGSKYMKRKFVEWAECDEWH